MLIDLTQSEKSKRQRRKLLVRVYGDFAPELILDLARLDGIGGVFADDLEEVFDAHLDVLLSLAGLRKTWASSSVRLECGDAWVGEA